MLWCSLKSSYHVCWSLYMCVKGKDETLCGFPITKFTKRNTNEQKMEAKSNADPRYQRGRLQRASTIRKGMQMRLTTYLKLVVMRSGTDQTGCGYVTNKLEYTGKEHNRKQIQVSSLSKSKKSRETKPQCNSVGKFVSSLERQETQFSSLGI